ncbi:MAG: sulfotransferase domain-containing protein [Leptolyngbya sp. SIO1D8]|nr:sulfotransferase domain-containing protein [Leptolyngbya sp. SIO1D8]
MTFPLTLIIGSQKCGTTSLFKYLAQHPQVCACKEKEPNFFANDENWSKGLQWYTDLWKWNDQSHKVAIEASPFYTITNYWSGIASKRIHDSFPEAKLIYLIRDPIRKIESARAQGYYQGWYAKIDKTDLLEGAQYAKQIGEYHKYFATENILILLLEDLQSHPKQVFEKVCDFLEIDGSFPLDLTTVHNQRNSYRKDTLWYRLSSFASLKSLAKLIPEDLKSRLRAYLNRPVTSQSNKTAPPFTPEEIQQIVDHLRDDLKELQSSYGIDISKWQTAKKIL